MKIANKLSTQKKPYSTKLNTKKSKEKEKFKFIFPNMVAKTMKNVPMRTQLESSMISMALIMCSLTLMVFYLLFFGEGTWPYRILLLVNLFAGFLFISSFLLTTYQQYISHMQMMGYDPQKERADVLKRGHLFKRIKLALDERKKVKIKEKEIKRQKNGEPLLPQFVDESLDRLDIIEEQKAKDFKELQKQADKLKEEYIKKQSTQEDSKQNQKFKSDNLKV